MSAVKAKTLNAQFEFYRPTRNNPLDLGFTLRGFHFRLVNPRKQERSLHRAWMPCTSKSLPDTFVKELNAKRPGFFQEDGLHRVNNDLVLYFMPDKLYAEAKENLDSYNREEREKLVGKRNHGTNVKTEGAYETEELGVEDFKN